MSSVENQEYQPKYGQVCWFEIPVYDLQRASKLYAAVFGWQANAVAVPTGEHGVKAMHMFSSPDRAFNGAFLVMAEGYHMTRHGKLDKENLPPLATFCVKDCDETLKQVRSFGGSTKCPKTAISSDMGYFAHFHDSEGNTIGIWSQN